MAHFWSTQPWSTENKLNGTIARDCIVLGKLNGNIKAAKLFPRLFHFQICEKMTENLESSPPLIGLTSLLFSLHSVYSSDKREVGCRRERKRRKSR